MRSKYHKLSGADYSERGRRMPLYVGLVVLFIGLSGYFYWRSCASWTETDITVLASKIVEQKDAQGGSLWNPYISYRYQFAGKSYESQQVALFGFPMRNKALVAAVVKRFPSGQGGKAFVNPRNPKKAYLIPNTEKTAVRFFSATVWVGAATVFLGALYLFKTENRRKQ